jgi:hypothetical protein
MMRNIRGVVLAGAGTAALMLAGMECPAVAGVGTNTYGSGAGSLARAAAVGSTVGEVMPAGGSPMSCGDITGAQSASGAGAPSYTVPTDGVVTGFSHNAGSGFGQLRGVMFRPTGVATTKTIIGKSALTSLVPNTPMTFPARIPVVAGDQLGIQSKNILGRFTCAFAGVAGDSYSWSTDDPDTTDTFVGGAPINGNRWNISAALEPDLDKDGYGDLSQDLCPQSSTTQAACPAPDVTVTKAPKKVSTSRKAKIKFRSSVPGSSFTCAVDGRAARSCTSPFKKKFTYGKHTVVITATSPLGLVDATPTKVKFRVKRRA